MNVTDPVGSGFVASFPRPGGNVTGFIFMEPTMSGKGWSCSRRLLARQPGRLPVQPGNAASRILPETLQSRRCVLQWRRSPHRSRQVRTRSVVAAQAREPNGSLIVMSDSFMSVHRIEVTSLAARYRLPTIYPYRFFAELGGCVLRT